MKPLSSCRVLIHGRHQNLKVAREAVREAKAGLERGADLEKIIDNPN